MTSVKISRVLRWGIVLFALTMLLTACAPRAASTPETAASPTSQPVAETIPTFTEEQVQHVTALAQMQAHLQASLANWEAGDYEMASVHAGHPVEELWELVTDELEEHAAAAPLKEALEAYETLAGETGDSAQVKGAHEKALTAAQQAMEALVSTEVLGEPTFRAALVAELLEGVEEEYGEAVENGRIIELEEYQDAWGFLQVAESLYEHIADDVESAEAEAAEEIEEEFEVLAKAFPSVQPPATPIAPAGIKEATGEIIAELGKTVGLAEAEALEPPEVVAEIRAMIAKALEEYAEGETDEAFEFAANAYLEGFEHIEGELIQRGHRELVEDLELKFKDLRDGVRAGKPQAELQALVGEIEQGLDEALSILTSGG